MTEGSGARPLRIGNAERDAAVKALDEHVAAGRLDLDEYGSRYAQALVARTMEDLRPLFDDLPAPGPFVGAEPAAAASNPYGTNRPWSAGKVRPVLGAAWVLVPAVFLLLPVVMFALIMTRGIFLAFILFALVGRVLNGGRWGYRAGYRRPHCGF